MCVLMMLVLMMLVVLWRRLLLMVLRMLLLMRRRMGVLMRMGAATGGRPVRPGSSRIVNTDSTLPGRQRRRLSKSVVGNTATGRQLAPTTTTADAGGDSGRDGHDAIHWLRLDARHYRAILRIKKPIVIKLNILLNC